LQRAGARGRIVGWEANGGFLTGSEIALEDGSLSALPTRDATLPILANLYAAAKQGVSLAALWGQLPARFGRAGLLDGIPTAVGGAILKRLVRQSKRAPYSRDFASRALSCETPVKSARTRAHPQHVRLSTANSLRASRNAAITWLASRKAPMSVRRNSAATSPMSAGPANPRSLHACFCADTIACAAPITAGGPCSQLEACCAMQGDAAAMCLDTVHTIEKLSGDPSCYGAMMDWDINAHLAVPCKFR
jgi:hypothetical protein